MSSRNEAIERFLAGTSWAGCQRVTLAGDASFRKYERVFLNGRHAVLMDAPPAKEDVRPFIRISQLLAACNMSAPKILASDVTNGFLLLEDLGDDLYARVLVNYPAKEEELYLAAADVLAELYEYAPALDVSGVPLFDMKRYMLQLGVFAEWFLPLALGADAAQELGPQYLAIWEEVLAELPMLRPVPVLYDFHAENLLWLPQRQNAGRVGLLDFQDAMMGSPAYDVVSFLEDARRDVGPSIVQKTLAHYLARTRLDKTMFLQAYALMGAQRNSRIIGTFVRLAKRDGKMHYLKYMPRVWAHLQQDVMHPVLGRVKAWMDEHISPEWRGEVNVPQALQASG